MDDLPYIDEHHVIARAGAAEVWAALIAMMRGQAGSRIPAMMSPVWGLDPARATGDWSLPVGTDDAAPGFGVVEAIAERRLALRGSHRFSTYALDFDLAEVEDGVRLTATSWGEFPGLHGRAYRALVIGSGGHRLVVRRMITRIARRAEAAGVSSRS